MNILRKTVAYNQRDWDKKLYSALWAYNATYKTSTNHTPYFLVYGQECVLPIEIELPSLRFAMVHDLGERESVQQRLTTLEDLDEHRLASLTHQEVYKRRMKEVYDRKARDYQFSKGQLVLFYDARHELMPQKLGARWQGPYKIHKIYENNTVKLMELNDEIFKHRVNINKIKIYWS